MHRLDALHEELVARVNGTDIGGEPLKDAGVPSQTSLDELEQEHQAITRSFAQDTVTVQHRHRDGTVAKQQVVLGKTMAHFRSTADAMASKVSPMLKELEQIDVQIAALLQELQSGSTLRKAERDLQATITALQAEVTVATKQTLDDIKVARKEDKAASEMASKKFQEFMRAL